MQYYHLAFFMGLFGSLHCVAMCGPLVLALPAAGRSKWAAFFNRLLYQTGRVLTYGLLGLLIGLIGNAVSVKGWQQAISIATGLFLVGMGLANIFGRYFPYFIQKQQQLLAPLTRWMGYWLFRPGGSFAAGILNGLLPCGMVYMAMAAALSAGTVWDGGVFMVAFGLGTLPLMLAFSLLGSWAKRRFRTDFAATLLPTLFFIMGIWFLLRGANLDIPFLSPLIYPEGAILCR